MSFPMLAMLAPIKCPRPVVYDDVPTRNRYGFMVPFEQGTECEPDCQPAMELDENLSSPIAAYDREASLKHDAIRSPSGLLSGNVLMSGSGLICDEILSCSSSPMSMRPSRLASRLASMMSAELETDEYLGGSYQLRTPGPSYKGIKPEFEFAPSAKAMRQAKAFAQHSRSLVAADLSAVFDLHADLAV